MSIQFEPEKNLCRNKEDYDRYVSLYIKLMHDDPEASVLVEKKIKNLDFEWAKQGEP